jgi:serine protease Do
MNERIVRTIRQHAWLLTALLVPVLVLAGFGWPITQAASAPAAAAPVVAPQAAPPVTESSEVAALQNTLEGIYAQVNPSVVSIQVVQKETVSPQDFPDLFPFFGPPGLQGQQPQQRYSRGAGSGFVWDKEGHIVTNNHVIAGADKISVIFSDGTNVSGKVVGADPDSDLAVVKVDMPADQLKPAQLADSTQLKVGQLAAAIGNPFGLEGSMTVGFVSSLGRLLPVEENSQAPGYTIPDVIQTDAPINPGNSGGVLVDDQGRVIGVTSAIISPVRASASIGFAIPSAIVQKVVPVLITSGKYEHPWLGLSGTSLNPDLAKAMNLKPEQRGALVVDVTAGGPSDKAGLKGSEREIQIDGEQVRVGGDVIVAINGQPVKDFDAVVTYLARYGQVNQEITLTLLRQGKEEQVKVTLEARPKTAETQQAQQPESAQAQGAWLGILGQTVTPEIAKAMNLPQDQQGVLVEQVQVGSPADQAGLRGSDKQTVINGRTVLIGGDIITAFNGQSVTQMDDLLGFMQEAAPGDKATLSVLRDGKQTELTVTLGERPTH